MAISFPYVFSSLSGNLPASDLDQNFTYTGTLPSQATTITAGAYTLTGSESVLINAGATPYGATLAQIAAATGIGTAAALAPGALATAAQVKTGSNNTQAVTPYSLNQNNLYGIPGYYTLPGGFLIQWGQATSASAGANGGTITFSQSFISQPIVFLTVTGSAAGSYVALAGGAIGTGPYTGYYFTTSLGGSYVSGVNVSWIAIGK